MQLWSGMEKVDVVASECVSYKQGQQGTLAQALAIRSFLTRLSIHDWQRLTSGFNLTVTEVGSAQLSLTIEVAQQVGQAPTQER